MNMKFKIKVKDSTFVPGGLHQNLYQVLDSQSMKDLDQDTTVNLVHILVCRGILFSPLLEFKKTYFIQN
ncbi:hypothetical protein LSH36_59g01002 [Paralvinella palmiformis]|uniref:Uncharacterized protein n=1 Tax=Paralvinella palmiformis TaxID=53620 RepID=A0AAD9K4M0_9ANNE|nr:hypothetical protein LSH36_59g01002 [Paralvinella palmiformis]